MKRLEGKVALITGGTQGVGESIALKFAREGARVVINGRSPDKAQRVLDMLNDIAPGAHFIRADVSRKDDCSQLVHETVDLCGRFDILINNAQTITEWGAAEKQTVEDDIAVQMQSGVLGSLWLAQAAVPFMKKQGGGRIVNFGSGSSTFGLRNSTAYNTTKQAMIGMTRTLANEWGRFNITVNLIQPAGPSVGFKLIRETRRKLSSENPEFAEQMRRYDLTKPYQPFIRIPNDEDVGSAVLGIVSNSGRFITGQVFNVDGGGHLWGLNQTMSLPGQRVQESNDRS